MDLFNSTLTTELPIWYIILCLLAGAGYSWFLYRNDRVLGDAQAVMRIWMWVMAGFRFIVVSLLAFLLLSPLIKTASKIVQDPVIIIAQDNSESILLGFTNSNKVDSDALSTYITGIKTLNKELNKKYEVKSYSFGSEVKLSSAFTFNEKQTNINELLETIHDQYVNQTIGAIIIASDGIFNQGKSPIYSQQKLNVPIYTIALGDTIPKKDLILRKVLHNRIVYLNNQFPLHIDIQALHCDGENARVTVQRISGAGIETLFNEDITITGNYFEGNVPAILLANQKGIQHYRISIQPVVDEATTDNNIQDIYIDVLDSKQTILLLANSPHPDISAMKQSITANENYEIDVVMAHDRVAIQKLILSRLSDYNMVILHQLPSTKYSITQLLKQIESNQFPVLYVVGGQSKLEALNNIQTAIQIHPQNVSNNQALPFLVETFSLFSLSEKTISNLNRYPPMHVPYGRYEVPGNSVVAIYQKIGSITTDYPLLLFNQSLNTKVGVLCGEGFWRWRLYDHVFGNNHHASNELMSKIIQFLSVKKDKRKFRVVTDKRVFFENEQIVFDAELYNESYELNNTPEIKIVITDENNDQFPFTFTKTEKAYTINAGTFPVGNYQFKATVDWPVGTSTPDPGSYTFHSEFSVSPLRIEAIRTMADHQLLYTLSESQDGGMFLPHQLNELKDAIMARTDIKPVSFIDYKTQPFINIRLIFFLLLILLSVEWYLRKRHGTV